MDLLPQYLLAFALGLLLGLALFRHIVNAPPPPGEETDDDDATAV